MQEYWLQVNFYGACGSYATADERIIYSGNGCPKAAAPLRVGTLDGMGDPAVSELDSDFAVSLSEGVCRLSFGDEVPDVDVEIMDMYRNVVHVENGLYGKVLEVDVHGLSPGMYIMKVSHPGGVKMEKLVVR